MKALVKNFGPLCFYPVQFDIMNNMVALAAGSLAVLLSHEDGE
jgi:hypothetical protein